MALTDYVIMPGEDYQAICDAVREKTGKTEALKSGDLSAEVAQIEVDDGSKDQLRKLIDGTIESYVFPEDVTEVRAGLFYDCKDLTSVEMHEGITKIGSYAFGNTTSLDLQVLPDSIERIDNVAFMNSDISIKKLPSALYYLGTQAFCWSLVSIESFPETLTSISLYAFQDCNNITKINIPISITNIGSSAFARCKSLASIIFEGGPSLNSSNIFQSCTALTNVTFKGTPSAMSTSVFSGCTALTTINVPWSEGEVANAPWGATNATINYNYTPPEETEGDET